MAQLLSELFCLAFPKICLLHLRGCITALQAAGGPAIALPAMKGHLIPSCNQWLPFLENLEWGLRASDISSHQEIDRTPGKHGYWLTDSPMSLDVSWRKRGSCSMRERGLLCRGSEMGEDSIGISVPVPIIFLISGCGLHPIINSSCSSKLAQIGYCICNQMSLY